MYILYFYDFLYILLSLWHACGSKECIYVSTTRVRIVHVSIVFKFSRSVCPESYVLTFGGTKGLQKNILFPCLRYSFFLLSWLSVIFLWNLTWTIARRMWIRVFVCVLSRSLPQTRRVQAVSYVHISVSSLPTVTWSQTVCILLAPCVLSMSIHSVRTGLGCVLPRLLLPIKDRT